jgi:hypothetical protein
MDARQGGWKHILVHEMVEYCFNFVYLAFFLVAFTWYRRLILAEYQITYSEYWMPLIEAAILAKVIMIGEIMRLGGRLERTPLILPTLYRTVVFSLWVALFTILEHTVVALLHGKGLSEGVAEILSKGRYELLGKCIVIFGAFVPFFAFKELEGVLGSDKLRDLFWRRATELPHAPLGSAAGEKPS